MAKFMKLEVKGKEYYIGFSNRASVLKAEKKGFMKVLADLDNTPVEGTAKILQLGLLEKHPDITLSECNKILDDYVDEHTSDNEEANIGQITRFIYEQYSAFSGAPNGKKKTQELPIVEM